MDIPNKLIKHIMKERVVPFIGAGFSRYFGYLGWNELLIKVKDSIGVKDLNDDDIKNVDPLQLAQSLLDYYKEKNYSKFEDKILEKLGMESRIGNKDKINEYLAKIIGEEINIELERNFSKIVLSFIKCEDEKVDMAAKTKLSLLGDVEFKSIITTNYDKVLENEIFKDQGYVTRPLGQGNELNWNEREKAIYKIHGDVDYCDNIIFTHSQYYKFMHEFGYFKSKLYTLFSNNVILMMGYGFNDINIHQIYFQFIRDYNSKISDDKFYMVLSDYDKKRWGSYFNYYKRFLKSYKINVIEVTNLPDFVEELSEKVRLEKISTDLSSLFDDYKDQTQYNFTTVIMDVINGKGKETEVYNDIDLNTNLLLAFHKIYKGPYILARPPFNKEVDGAILDFEIAYSIFDYVQLIIENHKLIVHTKEYFDIVTDSLDFISKTSDFYAIDRRVSYFIELSNKINKNGSDIQIGEKVYNMFSKCHPTEYLKSNPGGRTLRSRLTKVGDFYIRSYLNYILNELEKELLPKRIHEYWIDQIYNQYNSVGEITEMIVSIKEKIKKLKEGIEINNDISIIKVFD